LKRFFKICSPIWGLQKWQESFHSDAESLKGNSNASGSSGNDLVLNRSTPLKSIGVKCVQNPKYKKNSREKDEIQKKKCYKKNLEP
jgi:hypothetical protein